METTVITDMRQTVVTDRRYRRSEKVTQALAFQCAHIQEGLSLEAIVVSDDSGDRWVGSGDKSLCRLISRSASSLAGFDDDQLGLRMQALRTLKSDLDPSKITTYAIRVPREQRHVFVTGIGRSRLRDTGIVSAAGGVKRILGFDERKQMAAAPAVCQDPDALLTEKVAERFSVLRVAGHFDGLPAPRGLFGRPDDRQYAGAVEQLVEPAHEILGRSGLVVGSAHRRAAWRGDEVSGGDGTFTRPVRLPLVEPRSGARLGVLEVGLRHRHDRFEIVGPPSVRLLWR